MSLRTDMRHTVSAQVLVHSASANEGRTRDGVAAGGRRLAAEVEQLVTDVARRGGSLRTISLVGNSLGGYATQGSNPGLADFARDHSPHATALQTGLPLTRLRLALDRRTASAGRGARATGRASTRYAAW